MKPLLLATLAGCALVASAAATSAQAIAGANARSNSGWTTAPVAADRAARHRHAKPRAATAPRSDRMPASQEPMPQSPPGGY